MANLDSIVRCLDALLRLEEVPDSPNAWNGLQLANTGSVLRVGAAVDACLPVIERAVEDDMDLLLVHHGMFWQGVQPITDAYYRKLKTALDGDLAIYSAHLPLDLHPTLGNNALLCKALGIKETQPVFPYKGVPVGLKAKTRLALPTLVQRVENAVGGPVHICPGGPSTVRSLGVVTGGAGGEIFDLAAEGIDTLVTGEGPHWSYTAAEELGINVLYAGHYATETFGVKALAAHLASRYKSLSWRFLHHPTGL